MSQQSTDNKALTVGDIENEFASLDAPLSTEVDKEDRFELTDTADKESDTKEKEVLPGVEKSDDDEILELIAPTGKKEILKKYPNLFKDFPSIERAYFREQKFTEIFPTVKDAQEAATKVANYDRLSFDLLNGNALEVLQQVKEASPLGFNKIVNNYLATLGQVDKQAFFYVMAAAVERIVESMIKEADRKKNEDLKTAALILFEHIHGTSELKSVGAYGPEPQGNENSPVARERQQFNQERLETAFTDLSVKIRNTIKGTIHENIDPSKLMTDYIKENAVDKCFEQMEKVLVADTRFQVVMDNLWKKAAENRFSQESLNKIRGAYLSKAKSVLPKLIQRERQIALTGLGRNGKIDEDDDNPSTTRITPGRSASSSSSGNKSKEIPKNMRTVDYFLQDD